MSHGNVETVTLRTYNGQSREGFCTKESACRCREQTAALGLLRDFPFCQHVRGGTRCVTLKLKSRGVFVL